MTRVGSASWPRYKSKTVIRQAMETAFMSHGSVNGDEENGRLAAFDFRHSAPCR